MIPLPFCVLEEFDNAPRIDAGGFRYQLHRRCGEAGGGQERIVCGGFEPADSGPYQLGQCPRERRLLARRLIVHRPRPSLRA